MNNSSIIPVTHIITGLDVGGAEVMLSKLLQVIDHQRFPSRVISLTSIGNIGPQIESRGIQVTALGMEPGRFKFTDIQALTREIKDQKPVVVQTWMYHADLLGGWAAKRAGVKGIAWNIRNSTLDWKKSKASTLATVEVCAVFSHFIPRRIAVCSQAALLVHRRIGYAGGKMQVIPNGFDLSAFKPDPEIGFKLREQLGLRKDIPLVGLAARFDKQKDHQTFIKCAGIILRSNPEIHFLLCGEGITTDNSAIMQWVAETRSEGNFHFLGRWADMPVFHNACDVAVSSSAYGESFSNVLGEAMACGVPCVATRVGGAEEVLGNTGKLVPPGDPVKLAEGILDILKSSKTQRQQTSLACRERVKDYFDITRVGQTYMRFWEELSVDN